MLFRKACATQNRIPQAPLQPVNQKTGFPAGKMGFFSGPSLPRIK